MITHAAPQKHYTVLLSRPVGGAFIVYKEDRTRTHLNADVRWTSACHRLDGGNTVIFFPR